MSEPADRAHALLARQLLTSFPNEAALALERLSSQDRAQLLADEEPRVAAKVLRAMATPFARSTLQAMESARAAEIAAAMPVPWAASRLRSLPSERLEEVMVHLPAAFAKAVKRSLHYSSHSTGSLMDPTALSLAPDASAELALAAMREHGDGEMEGVFIVDRAGQLIGAVRVGALLAAKETSTLAELIDTNVPTLGADIDANSLATHTGWARWRTLPVIDGEGIFLGSVSYHSVQSLLLDVHASSSSSLSLPIALAELFWIGLAGITDGLARGVASEKVDNER